MFVAIRKFIFYNTFIHFIMKAYKAPLFIIALISLFSCGSSYVLSPELMEEVLVDMHLAEGIAIERSIDFRTTEDKLNLYSTVYAKHNTDKSQFDSSMVYYSENLDELQEIYEVVYERLLALEVEVKSGNFSPLKSLIGDDAYSRIVSEDKAILPFIQNELWVKTRAYNFKYVNFEKGISEVLKIDTLINRQLELRYTLDADSLSSAQCKVTMYYAEDKTEEKVFDLALASDDLVTNIWTVNESPSEIAVHFDAEPMNMNAKLSIKDVRLYDLSSEAHNISLFK